MIDRLQLTDVRNHAALALAPGPGFVVLTGENGAGKTNVLEAVSLLSPGRGLRRVALSAIARQGGGGGFSVAARIGGTDIGTGTLAATPERRVVRINGASATAAALSEWLSIVWLTPAMDRLFVAGAGDRRRFLDRLVLALEPAHALHATRYEGAMRERNRLLAADRSADPAWLAALERRMAEHGAAIDRARAQAVEALAARLEVAPEGSFARALVALVGEPVEEGAFAARLAAMRARDGAAGRALVGPHRADLEVRHRGKAQPAALCSTGEQKALLFGIVLAHAELVAARTRRAPVLLLDEVAAHLDPVRRGALFERLRGQGQVWMTGTESALFAGLGDDTTPIVLGG